jgi:predicted transcriptional regulator
MRTTVTLDPDVERLLKNEAHARGQSFKIALNEAVRQAFRPKLAPPHKRKPFVVKARPMGLRAGIDPARLGELADEMETDAFLATTKRLRGKRR